MKALCIACEQQAHGGRCDYAAVEVASRARKKFIDIQEDRIRALDAELNQRRKFLNEGAEKVIWITSLVSNRTQKPRIQIQVGEIMEQLDAAAALDIAQHIIECVEGAYADSYIVNFLLERTGVSLEQAASILPEFRSFREKLREEFESMNKPGEPPLPPGAPA